MNPDSKEHPLTNFYEKHDNHSKTSKTYILKIGSACLSLKKEYRDKLFESNPAKVKDQFVSEIYSALSASPHVMEVFPKDESLFSKTDGNENAEDVFFSGFSIWRKIGVISLMRFIKIRVTIPKRIRSTLTSFPWQKSPEQFNIYFNGAIFVAIAEIEDIYVSSDVGQVARDFLKKTFSINAMWESVEGIPPTPIHPDIYISFKVPGDEKDALKRGFSKERLPNDDLLIKIPDDKNIDSFMHLFLHSIFMPINLFYRACSTKTDLWQKTKELLQENQNLNKMISEYFEWPPMLRMLTPLPSRIRKLLAIMHIDLNSVSIKETELNDAEIDAARSVQNSMFFNELEDYFLEQMKPYRSFDRNSQLTAMNFAAQETNQVTIVHATLFAALIGAIVGGLISFLSG